MKAQQKKVVRTKFIDVKHRNGGRDENASIWGTVCVYVKRREKRSIQIKPRDSFRSIDGGFLCSTTGKKTRLMDKTWLFIILNLNVCMWELLPVLNNFSCSLFAMSRAIIISFMIHTMFVHFHTYVEDGIQMMTQIVLLCSSNFFTTNIPLHSRKNNTWRQQGEKFFSVTSL